MSDHAWLAPSSAHRWSRCPGSVSMEAAVPQEESDASREGTAAHWVAERRLRSASFEDGTIAPNGVVVTDEMFEGADLYAQYVVRMIGGHNLPATHIEERTTPGGIHPDCWGTPDLWHWGDRGLDLFDYKFGHRFVEVFENEQLICYAADILQKLDGLQDQLTPVHFHIVQPRSFHRDGPIRTWSTTAAGLRPHINRLVAAASAALAPRCVCCPTPEGCRDCRRKTACVPFQAESLESAALAGSSVPFDLSDAEAGRFLTLVQRAGKQLEAMETGLEAQLTKALLAGRNVPGWRLASGESREKWTVSDSEIVALGQAFGVNLVSRAVTPNQARKLAIDEAVISAYSQRPSGSLKLAPVDLTHSRKVFGK